MEYPKIHSLFKRDEKTHRFTNELSKEEFDVPHTFWHCEEKIDGTNMRIYIKDNKITDIKGRNDSSLLEPKVLAWINRPELAKKVAEFEPKTCILFGEGFGGKIQIGKNYRKDEAFILFDCYANGRWATRTEISRIAYDLDMGCPAYLGCLTTGEAIEYVQKKPRGKYGSNDYPMEGIICRSWPLVRFNDKSADPVMFKLKVKDFVEI
jgi:hypothetical protein